LESFPTTLAFKPSALGKKLFLKISSLVINSGNSVLAISHLVALPVSFRLLESKSFIKLTRLIDDGFTIFLDDPEAKTLVYDHVKEVNAQNRK
jgi:hypothetical protein